MKLNDTIGVNLDLTPKISNTIPYKEIDVSTTRHVNNLNLADPTFNVPNRVDLLLGADVIKDTLLEACAFGLCIRYSVFGWVVSRPVYSSGSNHVVCHMTTTPNSDSDQLLLNFWEIESVLGTRHLTLDERRCEEHFDSTTKRNEDGRFAVQMPYKDEPHNLGISNESERNGVSFFFHTRCAIMSAFFESDQLSSKISLTLDTWRRSNPGRLTFLQTSTCLIIAC